MTKPTGKLLYAYNTIKKMESKIEQLQKENEVLSNFIKNVYEYIPEDLIGQSSIYQPTLHKLFDQILNKNK